MKIIIEEVWKDVGYIDGDCFTARKLTEIELPTKTIAAIMSTANVWEWIRTNRPDLDLAVGDVEHGFRARLLPDDEQHEDQVVRRKKK